ncbi:MAG: cytochrome-c peroxidase [Crocinitomicaceae bacterium]
MNKTLKNTITFFSLSVLIILCSFSNQKVTIFPNEPIQLDLINNIKLLDSITKPQQLTKTNSKVDLIKKYLEIRSIYKKIETYIVFRYPHIDKSINGGPVPSITRDIVILHKDDPTGLQVIEELIHEDSVNIKNINQQYNLINQKCKKTLKAISILPYQNWEILEANHMALTRLMTLGLSGFDSPEILNSIPDAQIVLKQIQKDLKYFMQFATDFNWQTFDKLFTDTQEYLSKNDDFEKCNKYKLFKNYLIPIQKQIKELHYSTGYERYNEVSNIKRAIGSGDHLFSEKYLDPHFSMKGSNPKFNNQQIELGKLLFYDPILSKTNEFSCATCHNPQKAFTDNLPKSKKLTNNGFVKRNSPTLLNSCFQSSFFSDLRSSDMNDQIENVILNKDEFNTNQDEMVDKLKSKKHYQRLFKEAYFAHSEPITLGTIKSSLELYVRSLVALNSKFDKNIRNETNDLSKAEINGFNLFYGKATCATCHFAPHFNGFVPPHYNDTEGEILGVTKDAKMKELDSDWGMFEQFKNSYPEASFIKGMFKTPTLRNIELTGPYFHNGNFETLEEVLNFYNKGGGLGLGLNIPHQTLSDKELDLSKKEINDIISFLKTLTDTTVNYN